MVKEGSIFSSKVYNKYNEGIAIRIRIKAGIQVQIISIRLCSDKYLLKNLLYEAENNNHPTRINITIK
jgi:hypothetical protein